jgi:MFS family permease
VTSAAATASFVGSFGAAKALANLSAGALSERFSRRSILIAGWLAAIPVPLLIIAAPSWGWVVFANVFLGLNQGLAWSMTVNMKIDLVGPRRRGLALGLNEAAGYLSVAAAALASGLIAERYGLRPEPFYLGIGVAAAGLALSVLFVRDTAATWRARRRGTHRRRAWPAVGVRRATWRRPHRVGTSQAGFVNNLNDALAWAIFPLFFASRGASLGEIAALAAADPLLWGSFQLGTGWLSDAVGRRPLVVAGMLLQAAAISVVGVSHGLAGWWAGVVCLGIGTAMVYPVLLAAIGDVVAPMDRATVIGVYRFWRDAGALAGAVVSGVLADLFSFALIQAVAVLTALSACSWAAYARKGRPAMNVIPFVHEGLGTACTYWTWAVARRSPSTPTTGRALRWRGASQAPEITQLLETTPRRLRDRRPRARRTWRAPVRLGGGRAALHAPAGVAGRGTPPVALVGGRQPGHTPEHVSYAVRREGRTAHSAAGRSSWAGGAPASSART